MEELFERKMVHLKEEGIVILGRKEAQIVIMPAEIALKAEKEFISKQKVEEVIDKLISESHDMHDFVDDKKLKEVELFGNDKRELRERGYMRWAFEDGGSEALIKLKKELGL